VSSKLTRLSPSPGSMALTKMLTASLSFCTLDWPSPASSLMLPERSRTSATAAFGRATVLAERVTVQVCPVSGACTVTLPVALAPTMVEV